MYDIIEPSALGTDRTPRKLSEYEALILGDVSSMDDQLIAVIDEYVKNGGKILTTGFTSTKDIAGKPLNTIRLQSLGVEPSFENFKIAKSTYLKISDSDKAALGQNVYKNFSIMMMYSDFLKCKPTATATGYMKFLPETRFGPPEKSYYTTDQITSFPGVISNTYGKGKSVFIPWELGGQYYRKGHYMHRILFASALQNLLKVERDLITDASPLIEMTHLANRNGKFEWIGMINQSGQIGSSLREPIPVYNTSIRFKSVKPIKQLMLMNTGKTISFKQANGWVECSVPELKDFEMLVGVY